LQDAPQAHSNSSLRGKTYEWLSLKKFKPALQRPMRPVFALMLSLGAMQEKNQACAPGHDVFLLRVWASGFQKRQISEKTKRS
jgi:hypothetical protein